MSYLTCVRQHCASSLQLATATHKREAPTTQSLLASTGSRDSACGRSLCPGVGVVTDGHVTGGWACSGGRVGVVTRRLVTTPIRHVTRDDHAHAVVSLTSP